MNKNLEEYLEKYKDYKLCYVDGGEYSYEWITLYFTSLDDVTEQWGDDWNDAPYEHNAEPPYSSVLNKEGEEIPVDIMEIQMYIDSYIMTPCTGVTNSRYSVEQINNGVAPWISVKKSDREFIHIPAGVSLKELLDIIHKEDENIKIFILAK